VRREQRTVGNGQILFAALAMEAERDFFRGIVGDGALEDLLVVLVVEDDPSILSIVEAALTDGGFEPAVSSSGEEALTLLKGSRRKCRVLVTDIDLGQGKMDGWEVAKLAREIDPAFPIIYMTAASADQWAANGVPAAFS
jgi:CheY-like chemotaxis protein